MFEYRLSCKSFLMSYFLNTPNYQVKISRLQVVEVVCQGYSGEKYEQEEEEESLYLKCFYFENQWKGLKIFGHSYFLKKFI